MEIRQQDKIRPAQRKDITDIKIVIDSNALFPPELLDDMIEPFFKQENNNKFWIVYEMDGRAVAVAYFIPESMTIGTYNLLLIAVHHDFHGLGIGKNIMQYIESFLKDLSTRILLVETSGLPEFERTRKFYINNNYRIEAKIAEFYSKGEDKIIFWKSLQG